MIVSEEQLVRTSSFSGMPKASIHRITLFALCVCVWGLLVQGALQQNTLYSWDSAAYLEVAQSVVDGRGLWHRTIAGLDEPLWEPLALWPPGYPLAIAAVHWLGVPLPHAGVVVSLAGVAVFIAALVWILLRMFPWTVAGPIALSTICMPAFLRFTTTCLSEGLYMALIACAAVCVVELAMGTRYPGVAIFAVGFFGAAAWSVRNAGIALLGCTALFILFSQSPSLQERLKRLAILLLGAMIIVAPILARNLLTFGRLSPYTMPRSDLTFFNNLSAAAATIVRDLVPGRPGTFLLQGPVFLAGMAILVVGIVGWLLHLARRRDSSLQPQQLIILFLGSFAVAGILLTVAARTKYWWGEPVHSRYMIPYYWIMLVCGAGVALDRLRGRFRVYGERRIVAIMLVLCAIAQVRAGVRELTTGNSAEAWVSSWNDSAAGDTLERMVPNDQIVLACNADMFRVYTNLNARKIPKQPFKDFDYQRVIEYGDVARAGYKGILWGIIVDDIEGALRDEYGPWLHELVTNPDQFPNFVKLDMKSPGLVFRFCAECDAKKESLP